MGEKKKRKGYQEITRLILDRLREGTVPWRKPWGTADAPRNLRTKKRYRGINAVILSMSDFEVSWWVTENQARRMGGRILDGAAGFPIVARWRARVPIFGRPAGPKSQLFFSEQRFPMRVHEVFNVTQTEGLMKKVPEKEKPREDWSPIEEAERIVRGYMDAIDAPELGYGGTRAYYTPADDRIQMPRPQMFDPLQGYYSTIFHEMGHSTGNVGRLKRPGIVDLGRFGDHRYSREELVAEFAASFLCGRAGIGRETHENSASYIDSWSEKLESNQLLVIQAAWQAEKAAEWILKARPGRQVDLPWRYDWNPPGTTDERPSRLRIHVRRPPVPAVVA